MLRLKHRRRWLSFLLLWTCPVSDGDSFTVTSLNFCAAPAPEEEKRIYIISLLSGFFTYLELGVGVIQTSFSWDVFQLPLGDAEHPRAELDIQSFQHVGDLPSGLLSFGLEDIFWSYGPAGLKWLLLIQRSSSSDSLGDPYRSPLVQLPNGGNSFQPLVSKISLIQSRAKAVTTCDGWNRQHCHYCWRCSGQTVHLTLHFAFTRKQNPEMCSLWFLSKLLSRVTDGAIHSSLAGNHGVRHGGADSSQPLRAWLTLPRCRPRVWRTRWTGQISLCFILCCCFHVDLTVLDHNSHLYTLVYV